MKVVIIAGGIIQAAYICEVIESSFNDLFKDETAPTIEKLDIDKDIFVVLSETEGKEDIRVYLFEEERKSVSSSLEALQSKICENLSLGPNQVKYGVLFR